MSLGQYPKSKSARGIHYPFGSKIILSPARVATGKDSQVYLPFGILFISPSLPQLTSLHYGLLKNAVDGIAVTMVQGLNCLNGIGKVGGNVSSSLEGSDDPLVRGLHAVEKGLAMKLNVDVIVVARLLGIAKVIKFSNFGSRVKDDWEWYTHGEEAVVKCCLINPPFAAETLQQWLEDNPYSAAHVLKHRGEAYLSWRKWEHAPGEGNPWRGPNHWYTPAPVNVRRLAAVVRTCEEFIADADKHVESLVDQEQFVLQMCLAWEADAPHVAAQYALLLSLIPSAFFSRRNCTKQLLREFKAIGQLK